MSESNLNKIKAAYSDSTSKYQQWWILGSAAAAFVISVVVAVVVVGAPIFSAFSGTMRGLPSGTGANITIPSVTVPSLGGADAVPSTDKASGSALVLSEVQKAEGYTISSDGLVAWRYFSGNEVSALTCGGGEDFNDPCGVRHVYVVASAVCKYVSVSWQGGEASSIEPGKNGAPIESASTSSASDQIAQVGCEKT
jgi:hypothetical protein